MIKIKLISLVLLVVVAGGNSAPKVEETFPLNEAEGLSIPKVDNSLGLEEGIDADKNKRAETVEKKEIGDKDKDFKNCATKEGSPDSSKDKTDRTASGDKVSKKEAPASNADSSAPKDAAKRDDKDGLKRTDKGNAVASLTNNKRIIFGITNTANRMPRKFPLVFCDLERDGGIVCPEARVGLFMEQFYYDSVTNHCQHFSYNGCGGNANRFSTLWECNMNCVKKQVASIKIYP